MLPQKLRLKTQSFPRGAKVVFKSNSITIKTNPNKLEHDRVGVVLSKGTVKLASKRNYLKRIVMDFLGGQIKKERTSSGKDILAIIGPGFGDLKKDDIKKEIEKNGISL